MDIGDLNFDLPGTHNFKQKKIFKGLHHIRETDHIFAPISWIDCTTPKIYIMFNNPFSTSPFCVVKFGGKKMDDDVVFIKKFFSTFQQTFLQKKHLPYFHRPTGRAAKKNVV